MNNIIFLIGQPRSGTTLLQKMLGSHSKIKTLAEPWIILDHLIDSTKYRKTAVFNHDLYKIALNDFIEELPNKMDSYKKELRSFYENLYYMQIKGNETYFLDKTPRYYYIIKELFELFPNAKFIFIFRNPIEVASSILTTWGNDNISLLINDDDIIRAPNLLSEGLKFINKSNIITVKYHEIVDSPQKILKEVFDFLHLENEESVIHDFHNLTFKGKFGDRNQGKYKNISYKNKFKYQNIFNNKIRKYIVKNLITSYSKDYFSSLGLEKQQLLNDIRQIPEKNLKIKILNDIYKLVKLKVFYLIKLLLSKR